MFCVSVHHFSQQISNHSYLLFGKSHKDYSHLFTLRLDIFTEVEENNAEQENAPNHTESTGIVRVCTHNETLVLCMFQWSYRNLKKKKKITSISAESFNFSLSTRIYLCSTVKECVTDPSIVYFQLVDSVNVRNFKLGTEKTITTTLQNSSNERINANKL